MKKSLFIFIAAVTVALNLSAAITADWTLHMPFDRWPTAVVETPSRVYFMNRTFEYASHIPDRTVRSHSLFFYDKEGDEVLSVNHRDGYSDNAVASIAYNPDKKYLLVVYTDGNIDFLYENGKVVNMPAFMHTSITGKKEANDISFDAANNIAYVATSFGYITLNDNRYEVAESRNYGEDIKSVALAGDNIVMTDGNNIYYAPAADRRFNISDYRIISDAPEVDIILPLNNGKFIGIKTGYLGYLYRFEPLGNTWYWELIMEDPNVFNNQQVPGGHVVAGNTSIYNIAADGSVNIYTRPQSEWRIPATSYDGKRLWSLSAEKGLRELTRGADSYFTVTGDYRRPNAPATYIASSFAYHPQYGMLVGSNGFDKAFNDFSQSTPANVSALKGGFWKEYGPLYTNPDRFTAMNNYYGVAIDPRNQNYVYRGSTLGGLLRINLSDPNDMLLFAHPKNRNAGREGFIKVAEILQGWSEECRLYTPQFSADGTMWTIYTDVDNNRAQVWYWPAADRLATTSAANYRPMKKIIMPAVYNPSNNDVMIVPKAGANKNLVIMGGVGNEGGVFVYDHKGTPDTTADDQYVLLTKPTDQDGGTVTFNQINDFYEDPETGTIWILAATGVYTLDPATVFNTKQVSRIKVARNDGTNLADYLLNEVNVTHLASDGEGRKWFCTPNGLVCTSKDGKTILGEFTTENSYLPDDNVFAACYNPENNSMTVATGGGIVEMYPSGSGGNNAADDSGIRIYPNPVEPDYYGWVRMDNIADGSLVKITDSSGGIVKELGPVSGGAVEWDVSGRDNRRVSSGVYYVMVSPGSAGGNTQISKILVLN